MSGSISVGEKLICGSFAANVARCHSEEKDSEKRRRLLQRVSAGDCAKRDAMLALRHPLIVDFDQELSRRTGALIMNHYSNGDLSNFARRLRRAFDEDELWFVFTQLLEALCYVHEQGIVHGNVKPSNILITYFGRLQLADFGKSAVGLAPDEESVCETYGCGHSHLPPEAFPGGRFNQSIDFFSLASTVCSLASPQGRFPFTRNPQMSYEEVMEAFECPPHMSPLLPEDLRALLEPMLKIVPSERLGRAIDVFHHPVFVQKFGDHIPCMPWLPLATIFLNMSFIVALPSHLWLRVALWVVFGFGFYGIYGFIRAKKSRVEKENDGYGAVSERIISTESSEFDEEK